jgi:hypothetical protein
VLSIFFIFFAAAFFLKIHVKLVGGQTVCWSGLTKLVDVGHSQFTVRAQLTSFFCAGFKQLVE